ncbi:MAG: ABC transporter substrate-binding protein [Christensenellales bacterium]
MKKMLLVSMAILCLFVSAQAFAQANQIVLEYPDNMKEKGFEEGLILESMPRRVVCLHATPVLALHELGVPLVGIPKSRVVVWPESLQERIEADFEIGHGANFDVETVVALQPDLVLLGYTTKDTYGAILETAGIPTYYVDAGHTVSYESIKAQTEALIDAFDPHGKTGKEIQERFVKLEARLAEEKTRNAGKTVMVLQSSPPSHYIQSNTGTLGSMADMLGFENVYQDPQAPLVLLDLEVALSYNPDYVFSVGALPSGEEQKKSMEEDFANNPDYWNAIPAIKEGRILYLPISYISSAGINVVDNINLLIDQVQQLTD